MDIVWDFHGFRFQAHGGPTIFGGHISLQDGLHPSQSLGVAWEVGHATHEIRRFALHFLVAATVSVSNSLGIDFLVCCGSFGPWT